MVMQLETSNELRVIIIICCWMHHFSTFDQRKFVRSETRWNDHKDQVVVVVQCSGLLWACLEGKESSLHVARIYLFTVGIFISQ